MPEINIEVKLKDMEPFKKLTDLLKGIVTDNRIAAEVRNEIQEKINKIIEECGK